MKRLTNKHKKAMHDLTWHLVFEWGNYGDDWEFIADKSDEEKKIVEETINWMMTYSDN